ncbi:hypothetical protein C2S51_025787 [Perilla frutescens var. frutescens]|nr:hypothetical protein C2S51_025787 [Perilla frutescens var. frutescens]
MVPLDIPESANDPNTIENGPYKKFHIKCSPIRLKFSFLVLNFQGTVKCRREPSHSISVVRSKPKPASTSAFDYWDEEEFEGIPQSEVVTEFAIAASSDSDPVPSSEDLVEDPKLDVKLPRKIASFTVEIACVSFLIVFTINYFTGKKENENLALAWASKFATKDSIFDKNFSLLGVGVTDDSPLLLQEEWLFCIGEEEVGEDNAKGAKRSPEVRWFSQSSQRGDLGLIMIHELTHLRFCLFSLAFGRYWLLTEAFNK